jgi:hypothetical protein
MRTCVTAAALARISQQAEVQFEPLATMKAG